MPTNLQEPKFISNFAVEFRRETRKSIRKRCLILTNEVWKISTWQREKVGAFIDCMHLVFNQSHTSWSIISRLFLQGYSRARWWMN